MSEGKMWSLSTVITPAMKCVCINTVHTKEYLHEI